MNDQFSVISQLQYENKNLKEKVKAYMILNCQQQTISLKDHYEE